MKLIVGLGNPGSEYLGTLHNVGFMVVDRLARRHQLVGNRKQFHAACATGRIANESVMLMQPETFMNRSGLAVGEAARYHRLEPEDVMVVVDDTALALGAIRIRKQGSAGGHNGLADIEQALGSNAYPRMRVGIGEPRIGDQPIRQRDYVLGRFTAEQKEELDPALDQCCDAIELWLRRDVAAAMNQYNTPRNRTTDEGDKE